MRFCLLVSVFAFVLIQATAPVVSAGLVVDVNNSTGGGSIRVGGPNSQVDTESWTQTGSYTGVNISALIGAINNIGSPLTFDAYLTTAIGPSAGAPLDTAHLTVPSFGHPTDITSLSLFNGLSLGAGTYYLTVFSSDTNSLDNIRWATGATVNLGSGVSGLKGYVAANGSANTSQPWESTFGSSITTSGFTVTGTLSTGAPAAVPEPSSMALLGLGAIGLMIHRRRTKPAALTVK